MKVKIILAILVVFILGQTTWAENQYLSPVERKRMNIEINKIEKRVSAINQEIELYKSENAKLNELEARLNALNNGESLTGDTVDVNIKLENAEQSIVHINEKIEYYRSVTKGMKEEEIQIKEMREDIKSLNKEIK